MSEFSDAYTSDGDERLEEAAAWLARLHDPDARDAHESRRLRSEFARWIDAAPGNAPAYAEMLRIWERVERPAAMLNSAAASNDRLANIPPFDHPSERMESRDRKGRERLPGRRITPKARNSSPRQARVVIALAACVLVLLAVASINTPSIITHLASDYATGKERSDPIRLPEGSTVTLNADSAMDVDIGDGHRRVRLLEGEAWFDVASNPDTPFTVTTEHGVVTVTGTKFNIRLSAAGRTIVSLAEGRVALAGQQTERESGPGITLAPGQQSSVGPTGISAPASFDLTAVTAWRRGQFVFYDAPLPHVIDALNRHRRGRIILLNDRFRDLKVSGVFSTGDTAAALAAIEKTLSVKVTRVTDFLVFLR